jgi:hypothetical protein
MYEPSNPQADSAVEHRQVDQALFYILPGLFARSRSRRRGGEAGMHARPICDACVSLGAV